MTRSPRRCLRWAALLLAGVPLAVTAPASGAPAAPASARPLAGLTFAIDPGHNGGNGSHPAVINRIVNVVNGRKACDTAGTSTNAGYAESAFTFDLAQRLAAILRTRGAKVVLTRSSNTGVGPCITQRAAIGNQAHATAAISLHADGGPAGGYGFHVIEPAAVGPNNRIVRPSAVLGRVVRDAVHRETREPYATYVARQGLIVRGDLGGLNLSTVPKVFIECGNMRNAADARRLTSPAFRQLLARSLADGLQAYARR